MNFNQAERGISSAMEQFKFQLPGKEYVYFMNDANDSLRIVLMDSKDRPTKPILDSELPPSRFTQMIISNGEVKIGFGPNILEGQPTDGMMGARYEQNVGESDEEFFDEIASDIFIFLTEGKYPAFDDPLH